MPDMSRTDSLTKDLELLCDLVKGLEQSTLPRNKETSNC